MALSSAHSFSALARRQKGAQWSSFAAGGLCWDTKGMYCVKMRWSLHVCQKFQLLWSARGKKKINLTAVPLWTGPGNCWTSLAHTIVHLTSGCVALNFVNSWEHSWKRNSEIFRPSWYPMIGSVIFCQIPGLFLKTFYSSVAQFLLLQNKNLSCCSLNICLSLFLLVDVSYSQQPVWCIATYRSSWCLFAYMKQSSFLSMFPHRLCFLEICLCNCSASFLECDAPNWMWDSSFQRGLLH